MSKENSDNNTSFMIKLASFIVDRRNLIFLLVGIMMIFSLFSRNWVSVENDLTAFLPSTSATRQGLDLMEEQFTTFGSADVMIANISYDKAEELAEELKEKDSVQTLNFDATTDHYNNVSALYSITFNYPEDDDRCLDALQDVKDQLAVYDVYVSTDLGNQKADIIAQEVSVIMVLVAIVVVAVLLFTSETYAEIPVLLITFVSAMIMNLGSNFLLGTISFVSNSVTSILQLALSLDYAVILCNRFKEEHETMPVREAAIMALSKGIPEIGASSLTTIGGLVAMLFMQFKIGPDMGICLIKAVLFALFAVFVFMPGLLVLFGPLMDKTKHRNFIPKVSFLGKFAYKTRYIVPAGFVILVIAAFLTSQKCPYVYGYDSIKTPKLNEMQIADNMIDENFTSSNLVALMVPAGDYQKEAAIMKKLDSMPEVNSTKGLANIEAMDGYMLTDRITPRQFAELADVDYEVAELVYTAYAAENEEYGKLVSGVSSYSVPLIDIMLFVVDQVDQGYVTLDADVMDTLHTAQTSMINAKLQLQGEDYSRLLIYLNLPESGDETYAFTDEIKALAQSYYPDGNIYVVGNSTNAYEFLKSFSRDNIVVSVMSILIVLVVLLFTFKSAGMPILLIMVIQGSIWINFSVPVFTHVDLFFLGYLIVSAIQMGANIDYAIVIASRYMDLRQTEDPETAITDTINFALPTIITSATILAASGFLIGNMTSEGCIVGIGQSLGRGTVISVILVLLVLPQILIVGAKVIDKTSFSVAVNLRRFTGSGRTLVDGMVRGEINGTVVGIVRGTVDGSVNLVMVSGSAKSQNENDGQPEISGNGVSEADEAGNDSPGKDSSGPGEIPASGAESAEKEGDAHEA